MKEFDKLIKIVDILRSPRGCPWDRAQIVDNYKKYLLEESYELITGINKKNAELVKEEIGDLFLILVVIACFFKEKNQFTVKEALKTINAKLVSRHPHVFGKKKLTSKEEVLEYWIKSKAKKKKRKTIKDRLPDTAPSLFIADLFFREYAYVNGKKEDTDKEINRAFSKIKRLFESYSEGKNPKDILLKAVFEICRIAFFYKVDLENSVKDKVIKEAKKVTYLKTS